MIVRLASEAMGTRFELVLSGEDEFRLRALGEEALAAIEDEHRRLSAFDAESLVGRLNAFAGVRPQPVDQDLFDLLTLSEQVWRDSDGAFDPAIGDLMRQWGHRGEPAQGDQRTGAGFDAVARDPDARTVAFTRPGVAIDLGGIAKGYALDRAAEIIREAGIPAALLHGGTSSIVAIGAPPGSPGWRVRLGSGVPGAPQADLVLRDIAASISAPSGRISEASAGHIIDPRTGTPAERVFEAVAVGQSGTLADAWATALVVLGRRPDRMPPEIGSAVCTMAGWSVSPSLDPIFEPVPPDTNAECGTP